MIASMDSIFHLFIRLLCASPVCVNVTFIDYDVKVQTAYILINLIGHDTVLFLALTYTSKRDGILLASSPKLMSMREKGAILVRILNCFSCSHQS